MSEPRILVWFSCGGPSAVAAKLAIQIFAQREVFDRQLRYAVE